MNYIKKKTELQMATRALADEREVYLYFAARSQQTMLRPLERFLGMIFALRIERHTTIKI